MAIFVAKNVVKETSTTTGTGTYVLAGAVTGYDPFSVVGAGSKVAYKAENAAGTTKEIGIGTVSVSPNQLTRDEILRSPSGSAVNWPAGTITITLVGPAELLKVTAIAPGPFNGRLEFVSTTQIALQRYKGANLPIVSNGVWRDRQIPSAGVTLSNSTMAASTEYNIYAFWNVSAIGLEFSTTAHATDADTGIEIKSGDSTRLFVGRIKTTSGSLFASDNRNRLVASWLNSKPVVFNANITANRTTTSTTYVNINAELDCAAMVLHGFLASLANGSVINSGNNNVSSAISVDGTAQVNGAGRMSNIDAHPVHCQYMDASLSEGVHTIGMMGKVSGGTGTWNFIASDIETGIKGWVLG